jgi:hypothetical protein
VGTVVGADVAATVTSDGVVADLQLANSTRATTTTVINLLREYIFPPLSSYIVALLGQAI